MASWQGRLPATSEVTCLGVPYQLEGITNDGSFFYFRYRSGFATLGFGVDQDAAVQDSIYNGSQHLWYSSEDELQFGGELEEHEVMPRYEQCLRQLGYREPV